MASTKPQYNNAITSNNPNNNSFSSFHSSSFENPHVSDIHEPTTTTTTTTPTCCFNIFRLTPPYDSAMALTVFLLLTAFFFAAFYSIYIRRFSTANPTRSDSGLTVGKSGKKGVDPAIVESLPVYTHTGKDLEEGVTKRECVICLSEFEERECVKEIPNCGHVFHVKCLDTWLSRHVTCPLCRSADFFSKGVGMPVRDEREHVAGGCVREGGGNDTWREVGRGSLRRTSSCSWCSERLTLQRSCSF